MFDWNDLKYFLAVARYGSTVSAARALGVNQSTVQRRLAELERRLEQRLVERNPRGYRLTALGQALLPAAEDVAAAVTAFERRLRQGSGENLGVIRLTCPEPIAYRLGESGLLDRFGIRHPDLKVEFVLSDRYVDLVKGEADVALRSGDTDDGALVGRRVADSLWAVYGSRSYVAKHGAPASIQELQRHPLVGFDDSMSGHRAAVWLRQVAPDAPCVAHNNSVLGLVYAVKAGVGLAPLPTALGDAEPDLVRVLGPIPELTRAWRLLTHPDQRHTRQVSAFFDFMLGELDALKSILTG